MVHEVKNGKATRMSFSNIKEVIEMPDLIDIQKQSYEWFLKSGLKDVLSDASPITDFSGNLLLEFVDYRLEDETKYTIEEANERNTTYCSRLQVQVRLINKENLFVRQVFTLLHQGIKQVNYYTKELLCQIVVLG